MPATRVHATRRNDGTNASARPKTSRQVSARRGRATTAPPPARGRERAGLPGWGELETKSGTPKPAATRQPRKAAARPGIIDRIPTLRFVLAVALVCVSFTVYVGHIYATQNLASELQTLRKQNTRLHLKHDRLRGEFDRLHGPSLILEKARGIGLVENPAYGPTILVAR
jgi:cell division protein FtsB